MNWSAFETAVRETCARSLAYLVRNIPDTPVYGFGMEGGIEQGLIYVSANPVSARHPDTEWWLPDWSILYIEQRPGEDSCDSLFRPFSEPFHEMIYGGSGEESFEELCRLFRLSCLRALRDIGLMIDHFPFPRSSDFSLVYMDEADGFYCGKEAIEEGIRSLETSCR